MAGEIIITGDLKFVGYKQKANPGINRQVLTYSDGEAVWENLPAENLVTAPSSQDVIIDGNGDVVVSELDTYSGIDTKPILSAIQAAAANSTVNGIEVNNIITGNRLAAAYAAGAVTLNVQESTTQDLQVDGGPIGGLLLNDEIPVSFDGGII